MEDILYAAAAAGKADLADPAMLPDTGEDGYDSVVDPAYPEKQATARFTMNFDEGARLLAEDGDGPERKWYRRLNPLTWGSRPLVPEERRVSPEYKASILSVLTFQWMAPLMKVGYRRPLELNDIWLVNPDRRVDAMSAKLQSSFQKGLARGDKYPLIWAIHETFKFEFWVAGISRACGDLFGAFSSFALRFLIQFATDAYYAGQNPRPPHIWKGLALVFGITLMQLLQSLANSQFTYRGMIVGGQCRAALISAIFEKSLRISARAKAGGDGAEKGPPHVSIRDSKGAIRGRKLCGNIDDHDGAGWSNGKVINLMATDTNRIDQCLAFVHFVWTAPVSIITILILLLVNLTYSALAGFTLFLVGAPILAKVVKGMFAQRVRINKTTDQRVSLTQEILQGIRFVKCFGWEESFLRRLGNIRKREIWAIQILLASRNAINAVSMSLPIFASMLAFITYSLTNHSLNPARIFSSLALFNALRTPLSVLPWVIGQIIDAWSSISRIEEYLSAEEIKDKTVWDYEGRNAVEMKDAWFTWERTTVPDPNGPGATVSGHDRRASKSEGSQATEKNDRTASSPLLNEQEPFKLSGLNFSIGRKELIAVIGGVGSGKSSLLAALAGDMRMTNGEMIMGASRGFCPQYAWIQNATLRDNILFGRAYDRDWYSDVVDACALRPDIEMLDDGDLTEIGERGITVSGGQRQRLNIARAIYFGSDIVLLDDPLSAVDAHVGHHIFDYAICGLLKDKCRILATNQLHVLSRCDRIIWLEEGEIVAIDTFENLITHNDAFSTMMARVSQDEKGEGGRGGDGDQTDSSSKGSTEPKGNGGALMQAEERPTYSVPWSVYGAYISASGSVLNAPLALALLIISQGANIATGLWLSWWSADKFRLSTGQYIGGYVGLSVVQAFLVFWFSIALTIAGTTASKVMLHRAMRRTLRAPMSFFDTTPLGRITNRFSKDTDIMDNNLADAMRMYLQSLSSIVAVFILIIVYFHYFAVALIPLFLVFVYSASYYRASAREVKRHESVLRSNVFSRFGEALLGTASIRAYGLQGRFTHGLKSAIDEMDAAYFLTFANQRWLTVRLDAIGSMLVMTTGILVVTSRFNVTPSISGLALSYMLSIVQIIQFTVRQLAEVENAMNSTERIHYYGTQLKEEAPLHLGAVRPSWPEKGEIVFEDVQMRYREGLPLVLQGISLHVKGGERIGIVGRTGAGKSSIMSTLFRLIELSHGSITIDGVNIGTLGLHDLRSRMSIIPQDPTLFRGTVRSNIDPFDEHTDLELWSALRQSYLIPEDSSIDDKNRPDGYALMRPVEEEGLNFSRGQRQLMALARALVRGSQIIVCDEATSSVDMETDRKIQRTIATGFKGKTLLCIAHRLRTVLNYDRICVMDAGRIVELDTPLNLYDQAGSIFRGMCERSGIKRENFFKDEGSDSAS